MIFATKTIAARTLFAWAAGLFIHSIALAAIPIQHWTQPSGAQVWLVESPAIAMLDVQMDFDAGSRRDPPAQAGLAGVTASMLDKGVLAKGGAPALDENALNEAWADLGAQFGAGATADRMNFSLRSLTEPDLLDKAVALAARQMAEPAFPDPIWQRERERLNAAIRESNTRPATLAGRAYSQAVYGTHPYGYEMTEATLARISVADMQAAACRGHRGLPRAHQHGGRRHAGAGRHPCVRACCRVCRQCPAPACRRCLPCLKSPSSRSPRNCAFPSTLRRRMC